MEEKKEEKVESVEDTKVEKENKKEEKVLSTMPQTKSKRPSISIAGFVCALCGLITCGLSSFVGLVLSIIGFEKSKNSGQKDGLALAGIIISIIFIFIFIAVIGDYDMDNLGKINGGSSFSNSEKNEKKEPKENKEEYILSCETIDYERIARQPDIYKGTRAYFKGKIIQVSEGLFDSVTLRVNVTPDSYGFWSDTVYVTYSYKDGENKLLENDIVNMYGEIEGTKTYTTIFGASVTIPYLKAKYIEVAN